MQNWFSFSPHPGDGRMQTELPHPAIKPQVFHMPIHCHSGSPLLCPPEGPGDFTVANAPPDFQPFSSHGTHTLITKILQYTKNHVIFFAGMTKNRYTFDSFTQNVHCRVGYCHFFI